MEAQLGYMDEKEPGVQKPKKPPEIQVRKMLMSGSLGLWGGGWVWGPAQALPRPPGSQFRPLGLGEQAGSRHGGQESGFPAQRLFPALRVEAPGPTAPLLCSP